MGLDIMHYKICSELENEYVPKLNITTKSDIQRFDANTDYFKDYWKPILKYSYRNNYKVTYEEKDYNKAKQIWNEWNPNIEVILSSVEKKQDLISELSKRPENENLHLFIKNEMDYESFNFYHATKIIGFYSKQIGYQRKGVQDEFFNIYNYEKTGLSNFVQLKDFESVYDLIGKYYDHNSTEDVKSLKNIYKRDFIQKYEQGKSILTISY